MEKKIRVKKINIKDFDISKWEDLLDEVYTLLSEIFIIKKEPLKRGIFYQSSVNTNLYMFYDEDKLIGLNLVNIYEYNYKGADYSFFRFLSAVLPSHRGNNNVHKVAFKEAFKYVTLNPTRKVYYLSPIIHPGPYSAVCKISSRVYPSLKSELTKEQFDLMVTISDLLGFERVEGESLIIRNMHLITKEDENYKPKRISNRAKFFMETNPNYKKGHGLITLIPLDIKNVTSSFINYLAK